MDAQEMVESGGLKRAGDITSLLSLLVLFVLTLSTISTKSWTETATSSSQSR